MRRLAILDLVALAGLFLAAFVAGAMRSRMLILTISLVIAAAVALALLLFERRD